MNRLQLWKVVSVVLLACGLASAQNSKTSPHLVLRARAQAPARAPGALASTRRGRSWDPTLTMATCFTATSAFRAAVRPAPSATFNAPGAGTAAGQGTITFSINLFGVIAGYYIDANNVAHGFVTAAPFKNFITLTEPDAGQGAGQGTFAGNVNLGGEIAGNYVDASGVSHGFVTYPPYRTFTSFDPVGSVNTLIPVASALNLEGTFTGTYFDASGVLHGFVRAANGTITEYNVKGAGTGSGQGTEGSSISDLGATTGNYIDSSGVNHGFVRGPFGAITTFNVSAAGTGSGQGTVPEGIDLLGRDHRTVH